MLPPTPAAAAASAQGKHVSLVGICARRRFLLDYLFHNAVRREFLSPFGAGETPELYRRRRHCVALWELQCLEGKIDACAVTVVEPQWIPTRPLSDPRVCSLSRAPNPGFPLRLPVLWRMEPVRT